MLGLYTRLRRKWLHLELYIDPVFSNLEQASLMLEPLPSEHILFTYLPQHQPILKYSTYLSLIGTKCCGPYVVNPAINFRYVKPILAPYTPNKFPIYPNILCDYSSFFLGAINYHTTCSMCVSF